jgi:hypothetical protein
MSATLDRPITREEGLTALGLALSMARSRQHAGGPPARWDDWLRSFFPRLARHPFAPHHVDLWQWADAVTLGTRPRPFVEILARGGGKSSSAEMMTVYWAARASRRYLWYISETQEQADDHVSTIGSLLESDAIAGTTRSSPRSVGKFGNQRGWRRNRLWTADGFVVDALGLDVASRGKKLDEQRPDGMIFDDLDASRTARRLRPEERSRS